MKKMFPVFLLRSLRQHASTLFTNTSHESKNLLQGNHISQLDLMIIGESGDKVIAEIEQRAEEAYSKNTDLITDRASEGKFLSNHENSHIQLISPCLASYSPVTTLFQKLSLTTTQCSFFNTLSVKTFILGCNIL